MILICVCEQQRFLLIANVISTIYHIIQLIFYRDCLERQIAAFLVTNMPWQALNCDAKDHQSGNFCLFCYTRYLKSSV